MAAPRVFVSSTWYDLKYIRENLKYFIRSLGYEPVLSEEGSIFFDPQIEVKQAAIAEVPNCQLFILVIGGRFGSEIKDTGRSVTNEEYHEAVRLKIPVFALVEQGSHSDFSVYVANRGREDINTSQINYPSVDDHRIFEFISEVRGNAINNALVPFRDFGDIESYLRQQWASMMFSYITTTNEEARIGDTLSMLTEMNERIEMLSKQILRSVGTEHAKLSAQLYDLILSSEAIRDLAWIGLKPTPVSVLLNSTYRSCAKSLGGTLNIVDSDDFSLGSDSSISRPRFEANSSKYKQLRQKIVDSLGEAGMSAEEFVKGAG